MPTAEEIRAAVHWWQQQTYGTEEDHQAAVAMANLLRRVAAAIPHSTGQSEMERAAGDRAQEEGGMNKQPNGLPADARIIGAIQNLCIQMAVCGLKEPVGIVLAPGELRRFEVAISGSDMLLVADQTAAETTVWGVRIMEQKP